MASFDLEISKGMNISKVFNTYTKYIYSNYEHS